MQLRTRFAVQLNSKLRNESRKLAVGRYQATAAAFQSSKKVTVFSTSGKCDLNVLFYKNFRFLDIL